MLNIFLCHKPALLSRSFFSFDMGDLMTDSITGAAENFLGEFEGMVDGTESLVAYQYRLAFEFKGLFNAGIQAMFNNIAYVTTFFALFLIVLVFIKKGVACYILWTDGDPDVPPSQLVVRLMAAVISAVSMSLIYELVIRVASELISALDAIAGVGHGTSFSSLLTRSANSGLIGTILHLVAACAIVIAAFKIVMEGLILTVLQWILPIACVGLLDNDKGVFAETWKALIRTVATVALQYYLINIGIYAMVNTNGGLFGNDSIFSLILAIFLIGSSGKVANLLTQIFVPVQQGGGLMNKVYPAMMVGSMVGRAFR
ncbi:MAG: DUF6102 family protein [Lachnospiraceae bacterium]|nr:DUF6102 family protein [Lachnospiraceae bacterium]